MGSGLCAALSPTFNREAASTFHCSMPRLSARKLHTELNCRWVGERLSVRKNDRPVLERLDLYQAA